MTNQEEEYIHFVQSIRNLNNAWNILQEIKQFEKNSYIINAAFQFALVEYSKPYKYSRGTLLNEKKKPLNYNLKDNHIPAKHKDLHNRIINARDQIHAHSDLTILESKVYVEKTPYGKFIVHVQNKINGTEELCNLDAIIELIEITLDNMYKEEKIWDRKMPDYL